MSNRVCSIENCNRKHEAKDLCKYHYQSLPEMKAKRKLIRRQYYLQHRDLELARKKQYYYKNIAIISEQLKKTGFKSQKKWCINNPNKRRLVSSNSVHKRRTAEKSGNVDLQDLQKMISRANLCPLCLKSFDKDLSIDHIIPIAYGGSHSIENLWCIHKRCNSIKHTRYVAYCIENNKMFYINPQTLTRIETSLSPQLSVDVVEEN